MSSIIGIIVALVVLLVANIIVFTCIYRAGRRNDRVIASVVITSVGFIKDVKVTSRGLELVVIIDSLEFKAFSAKECADALKSLVGQHVVYQYNKVLTAMGKDELREFTVLRKVVL